MTEKNENENDWKQHNFQWWIDKKKVNLTKTRNYLR